MLNDRSLVSFGRSIQAPCCPYPRPLCWISQSSHGTSFEPFRNRPQHEQPSCCGWLFVLTSITASVSISAASCLGTNLGNLTLTRRLRSRITAFHPRQGLRYPLEQILDIVAQLRTRLHEHEVALLGLLLALLSGDFALVVEIGLVAHEDDDDVVAAFSANVVDPFLGVLEGFGVFPWALAEVVGRERGGEEGKGGTHWRCRRRRLPRSSRGCRMESRIGSVLDRPYPRAVTARFGPRGTSSSPSG